MSFGTQKRFTPSHLRQKQQQEQQEQQELHSIDESSQKQRQTPPLANPTSCAEFHLSSAAVAGAADSKNKAGILELDSSKVKKAAKFLSESIGDAGAGMERRTRSNRNTCGSDSSDPSAFGMRTPLRGGCSRRDTAQEDSHKRLEREERQYRRRLDLLQSQTLAGASKVQQLQQTINELQSECAINMQESIHCEQDSDSLSASVGQITRQVEASESTIGHSNQQVSSLHEIFEAMLERIANSEQTYISITSQQQELGSTKEKMLQQQEHTTKQVEQLGKTVSKLQDRMHDLTQQLSEESAIVDQTLSENRALKETYRTLENLVARGERQQRLSVLSTGSDDTERSPGLTEGSGNTTRSTSDEWWPSGASTASATASDLGTFGTISQTVADQLKQTSVTVELDEEMCMSMTDSAKSQRFTTAPNKHLESGCTTSDTAVDSTDFDPSQDTSATSKNGATAPAVTAAPLGLAKHSGLVSPAAAAAAAASESSAAATTGAAKIRWKLGDEKLGEGAFARVYMGLDLDKGHIIAVKELKVRLDNEPAKEHLQALEKEIRVMKDLHHPNIVRYIGTERSNGRLFILLEYVPGGSITMMLKRFGALGEGTVCVYCKHILAGLTYLHDRNIVHRDIKGGNLLVGEDGVVKLADFGCSIQLADLSSLTMSHSGDLGVSSSKKAFVMNGSVPWMAPEEMSQRDPGQKADIWSFGCTIVEMLTGQRPWPSYKTHMALMFNLMTKPGRPPLTGMEASLSSCADGFLDSCFQIDPNKRWTARQLSQHTYVVGMAAAPRVALAKGETYREVNAAIHAEGAKKL